MRFAYPALLGLIPLALAVVFWDFKRLESRRAALLFPVSPGLRAQAATLGVRLARFLPPALKAAALLLVAVGLARPQKVTSRLQALGRGIDIMLAVDTSLSMSAIDFKPFNRLDAAKDTARRFILGRAQDRIGIVAFGGATELACPLTADYDAVIGQLSEFSPGMTRVEGTAIGDGIASAVNHLKSSPAKSRIVILLTDGRSNTGQIDPVTAAKAARSLGIRIYTIGTAKRGAALMPVEDPIRGRVLVPIEEDLDEDLLGEVANLTEGRYFRATNLRELREIYDAIDKLEKSSVKLPDIVSHDDIYRGPVLAAALLLLLEAALSNTWLLRWP